MVMQERVKAFLKQKNLVLVERIGKGWSSEIFLVKSKTGKKLVLKAEKEKSPRFKMAEREAKNLRKANSKSIGPKLKAFDLKRRVILMEYVRGPTFAEWLFEEKPGKTQLKAFAKQLLRQAEKLDSIGLDHGQLAGRGANILVKKGKALPVIIDFEKASQERKCHNRAVVEAFLFRNPHAAIAQRVRKILGKEEVKKFTS